MPLIVRYTNIENWQSVCFDTFTGTPDEMDALVQRVTFFGPDWGWTDDTHTSVKRVSVTTHVLGFAMMQVGLNGITRDNAERVWSRLATIEAIHGAFRRDGDGNPVYFAWTDVEKHIGLHVNVGNETDRTFNARVKRWKKEKADAARPASTNVNA